MARGDARPTNAACIFNFAFPSFLIVMAFIVTVVAGKTFVPNEKVTIPSLNLLGQPTISVTGDFSLLSDFNSVVAVSKAFSVFSLADDQITVTAHGLTAPSTVDNAVRAMVSNSGGALPGGLVASTSYFYYIRVVDANTLTLHTTAAGALANTQRVDITSNGTGTHSITWTIRVLGEAVIRNASTSKYEHGVVGRANLPEMIGASASANGARGAVPQPKIGDQDLTLFGDGTWRDLQAVVRTGADLYLYHNSV
jgi:hypothetical protein